MKTYIYHSILTVSVLLFLSGCLNIEKVSLFVDMENKTGEIKYLNIGSGSSAKEEIDSDFITLIEQDYLGNGIQEGFESIKITSKELYERNGHLNGKVTFSFAEVKGMLEDFEMKIDPGGNYIYELSENFEYLSGNGEYLEKEFIRQLKWNKDVKKIEYTLRFTDWDDQRVTSLLSRWQDWEEKNQDK
jgi:hypothetical protein